MAYWCETWCGRFFEWWLAATLADYGHLVLAVIVAGWFWARIHSYAR